MAHETDAVTGGTTPWIRRKVLLRYGLLAVIAVSAVNVTVLYLALRVGDYPAEYVGGPFGPLAVGPVVVNSVVAAIGATVVYGLIARYSTRPNRAFAGIAGIVLVLSFAMFLAPGLSGAPRTVFVALGVMHVTVAVVIVGVVTQIPHRAVESNRGA